MNQYNVWNKWGKLKSVMLGDSYRSEFFREIKNNKIRSALQRIADETQEDLEYYEHVLKDFGCTVIRPTVNRSNSITDYTNPEQKLQITSVNTVPRGPLQVRDNQFVAGNKLFVVMDHEKPIIDCLLNYNNSDVVYLNKLDINDHKETRHWTENKFNSIKGDSWKTFNEYKNNPNYFNELPTHIKEEIIELHAYSSYENYIDAPSHTIIGRDLYVDSKTSELYSYQEKKLLAHIPNVRLNKLNIGGHNDSCFSILKPGVLLSLNEIQEYKNTFPGWEVCYLPDASFAAIPEFMKLKEKVNGKWWVPGEEDNDEFTYFVETWLQDWVGYVEETVFDVNVLVLDEHHVCVNNMNPTVIEFLKKHKMEPVHIPWRHRYFYDGGIHCITLDLEREGVQEDYFPERGDMGIVDYGFD